MTLVTTLVTPPLLRLSLSGQPTTPSDVLPTSTPLPDYRNDPSNQSA
jgi:hypothetical protein